jgi:hypothetical protein
MTDKCSIIKSLIAAITVCLLVWDVILCIALHLQSLPHQDWVLTGCLLWLASLFFPQQSDDDWAGQF